MPAAIVVVVYGCSVALALLLLHLLGARAWYWHVLSLVLAFVIGLAPVPKTLHTPFNDLLIGSLFLLLLLWGICAPFFGHHHGHHERPRHA